MKKLLYGILFSIFLCFPLNALAEGYISALPEVLEIKKGETATFTITAYNSIGDVSIVSSSVDIATVSSSEWSTGMVEEKQTKEEVITVTGVNEGTATITLNIDGATFDEEDLSGLKTIIVTVKEDLDIPSSDDNKENEKNDNNLTDNSDDEEENKASSGTTSSTTENPNTGVKIYTIFGLFLIVLLSTIYFILIKKNKFNRI